MRPIDSPTRGRLSIAMKEGSAAEHVAAEQSAFISELLAGRVTARGYSEYLLRLRVVYAALEDAMRACRKDPMVAAVYDPALERVAAIDADLRHWRTDGTRDVDSPAATAYSERIAALAWGGSLLAHHYTRYLGDLSGGRIILHALDRAFDLRGVGVAFYEFPMRPKPYKDSYRARLDALRPSARDVDRIVDEVRVAFGLNHALLDELAGD
ncbi:heme oxygenase [Mycobacterium sp. E1715]|uniref:biliverdin-producing heme oxygenase n=1 Tax=unclassified Mycobacterium TaxID=2642494 RepID=UPI0007FD5CBD|nr:MULTISPECIES: biliverdin-producing heme oxygenase [unclassified Mycobacterium]OBG70449.1 heme oxygenase [Mycobacterium sp. E3298]OBG79213.1 heme oxygenase [Mycobacterium sp. E3305]OBH15971.1 heme oxygenase [Mycobacterium sp. E1715]